ncbi:putative MFS family arabinose efflux permease [Kribbella orskensis]|uniref:MFS family arabinose efflux permease n=1 Tax=Kribbella orskensis TaxID=2512216 RepID=A0ABY2BF87_9ACTN|nr:MULTISPECIES: MFS transporter [Kribbella]TCN36967.1 putative MFS family arabinose efflux permease [Kribbella sp. VKM Ac-2500]TCO18392.1 putative MFS family arabinose efflux permease [Kribbella orskensis]
MPALTGRIRTPKQQSGYRTALRTPGAWKFYLAAAPARIGIAMTGLGIVWLIHGATGSYAAAGTVTGGFAVAEAIGGPQVARLIDRFGQTRMLPLTLLLHTGAAALLIGLAVSSAPLWMLVGAGVLAGGSLPQIGAQTAARWSHALRGSPVLSSAFALESLGTGLAFLVGPALIGTVSALVSPVVGSGLATILVVAGGLSLSLQRRTAPPPGARVSRKKRVRLMRPGFLALVGTSIGVGLFFGAMQVSVTAFAVGRGTGELAGPLYSVTSLVSLLVGFAYGARRWRLPAPTQLVLALGSLFVLSLPLLTVDQPLALGIALALPGAALAPYMVLSSVLTESRVAPAVLTQAFTWLNSGTAAGIAAGAGITGRVVDAHSPHWGFGLAVLATLVASAMGVVVRSSGPAHRPPHENPTEQGEEHHPHRDHQAADHERAEDAGRERHEYVDAEH